MTKVLILKIIYLASTTHTTCNKISSDNLHSVTRKSPIKGFLKAFMINCVNCRSL